MSIPIKFYDRALNSYIEAFKSLKAAALCIDHYNRCSLHTVSAYRHVNHCMEMMSKAIIERVHPKLLLENLQGGMDDFSSPIGEKSRFCTTEDSLNRAMHFISPPIEEEQFKRLVQVVVKRGGCEHHSSLSFHNSKSEIKSMIDSLITIEQIYERMLSMWV